MPWWTALPTLAATLVVFWLPGLAVLAVLGVRGLRLAALAPAVGAGVLGVAAAAAGPLGVRWDAWTAAGVTALATAVCWGVARVGARRAGARPPAPADDDARPVAPRARGVLVAALAVSVAAQLGPVAVGMGRPDRVQNAWDALFHLRAVVAARDALRVDPFWTARLLDPSGGTDVYPSGWHALAALVPSADPRVAVTAAAVVPCVVAFTLGVTLLAREVWRAPTPTLLVPLVVATGVATPLAIALQPGLVPNAFAIALVPAVLSLVVHAWRRGSLPRGAAPREPRPGVLAAAGALGVVGAGAAHPNAALGAAVLAAPWVVAGALRAARPRWHAGRRVPVVAVAAVALAALVAGVGLLLTSPSGRILASVEEDPGLPPAALLLRLVTGDLGEWSVYPVLPTLLALGAAVAACRRPGRAAGHHLVVALGLVLGLYVVAASGVPALSPVTVLWYSEPRRLAPLAGACLAVLAAGGLAAAARAAARHVSLPDRWTTGAGAGVLAGVVVALAVVPGVGGLAGLAEDTFTQDAPAEPDPFDRVPYLTAEEEALVERLAGVLDTDALLLGSSFSGPGHLAALTGQRVVQPYHTSVLDDRAVYVSSHLADLVDDPRVCAEVRALDARYVWVDPYPLHSTYWTFAAGGTFTQHPGGLTPLDEAGSTAVYDLGRCYES